MNETPKEVAQRDMIQDSHSNGLTLSLPNNILFDADEFFSHYTDYVIDRQKEHRAYIIKRDSKEITKRKLLR